MFRLKASAWAAAAVLAWMPVGSSVFAEENCEPDEAWLPATPAPLNNQPESPLEDCSAYRWAWQTFLRVTGPDDGGHPAFLGYEGMNDLFGPDKIMTFAQGDTKILNLAPRTPEASEPDVKTVIVNGIKQASVDGVLVDQNNHAVYYAIHMNPTFTGFVRSRKYNDKTVLADPASTYDVFPKGALELKSSWQIVDDANPPADYITTKALVPTIGLDKDGNLIADPNTTREVTVALLGIHVVGVIENHPEFIWSSFEHVGLAPNAADIPSKTDPKKEVSDQSFPLYAAHTPAEQADTYPSTYTLDAAKQTLSPATSVYRAYPGANVDNKESDEAVDSLNENIGKLFASKAPADVRAHYRLIGAVWLKNGAVDFALNDTFVDPDNTPEEKRRVAGENAMSNMAIESFTQTDFPSCFSCHKTRASSGLKPKLLNVSHILSLFYQTP